MYGTADLGNIGPIPSNELAPLPMFSTIAL